MEYNQKDQQIERVYSIVRFSGIFFGALGVGIHVFREQVAEFLAIDAEIIPFIAIAMVFVGIVESMIIPMVLKIKIQRTKLEQKND